MEKGAATLKRVVPGARGQVGHDRARRRRLRLRRPRRLHGLRPRRPGLRHADPACSCPGRATTRASSSSAPPWRRCPTATRSSDAVVMGPVVSARQRDRVLGYIEKGQEEGAKLVVGGGRPAHLPKGWFVEPTLFVDVDNSMTIAQEEIFGPVLAVIPYEDDDDAVRIANESTYGLSGGVVSASEERATAIGPAHPHRLDRASTAASGTARTRPTAATRTAAWGASAGSRAWSSISRPRPSPGHSPDLIGSCRARCAARRSAVRPTTRRGARPPWPGGRRRPGCA